MHFERLATSQPISSGKDYVTFNDLQLFIYFFLFVFLVSDSFDCYPLLFFFLFCFSQFYKNNECHSRKRESEMESLQRCVLHRLAVIFWQQDFLQAEGNHRGIFEDRDAKLYQLVRHRKRVQDHISKSLELLLLLPPLLVNNIICAVTSLQQGYEQILHWESSWFLNSQPTPPLYRSRCGRFIDPGGHFNDVAYAKSIVVDVTQPLTKRFKYACCYCFEEYITNLHNNLITKYKLCKILDTSSFHEYTPHYIVQLIALWTKNLDEYHVRIANPSKEYFDFLILSLYGGLDHAARFFWARCPEAEKTLFLREKCVTMCEWTAKRNRPRVAYFLYTLLTPEIKTQLRDTIKMLNIWNNLLVSECGDSVIEDILSLLPINWYTYTLHTLSKTMQKLQIPHHTEIYRLLLEKYVSRILENEKEWFLENKLKKK